MSFGQSRKPGYPKAGYSGGARAGRFGESLFPIVLAFSRAIVMEWSGLFRSVQRKGRRGWAGLPVTPTPGGGAWVARGCFKAARRGVFTVVIKVVRWSRARSKTDSWSFTLPTASSPLVESGRVTGGLRMKSSPR